MNNKSEPFKITGDLQKEERPPQVLLEHGFGNIGADGQSIVHLFFKFGFLLLVGLTFNECPNIVKPKTLAAIFIGHFLTLLEEAAKVY